MAAKRAAKKDQSIIINKPVSYEIRGAGPGVWITVDRANVLRDGCLHWEYGDSYGIKEKGKWRVAR